VQSIPRARKRSSHLVVVLAAGACLLAMLAACHVTPYWRTLPAWVQRAYIPMFDNQTAEPGLEELLTNAFIEEILADGRVESVQKSKCDVVVRVSIMDYAEAPSSFSDDDIESAREITLGLKLELFDPKDPEVAIATTPKIEVVSIYHSERRSVSSLLHVDALERLGQQAGRQLVHSLITQMEMVEE